MRLGQHWYRLSKLTLECQTQRVAVAAYPSAYLARENAKLAFQVD